jgi:hypothetical protein
MREIMASKKLWELPIASTKLTENGVRLIYPGGDAWLLYDYYDENDVILNSGIFFDTVLAHRHASEKLINSLIGAYDYLVEIINSEWLKQMKEVNKQIVDFWNLKHFAIFFDSNGLCEFLAKDYKILEINAGRLTM